MNVRYGAAQIVSSDGHPPGSIEARLAALRAVADKATKGFTDGEISAKDYNSVMQKAEKAQEDLQTEHRTRTKALQYGGSADSAEQWQANGGLPSEAARCKAPMSVEFDQSAAGFGAVQLKAFNDGDSVRMKQTPVGEGVAGASGSLVPPVLVADMYAERLESDRIWAHLQTVSAVGQWATYIQHPSNTNPAAPTAELATIPTLDSQYQAKTVVFTKIAAQQAYSVEMLEDTNSDVFAFAGSELSRKSIDAESDFLINNQNTSDGWSPGLLYAPDTQSLSALSLDSPIDAILAAYELIRSTTQSFAPRRHGSGIPSYWPGYSDRQGDHGIVRARSEFPSQWFGPGSIYLTVRTEIDSKHDSP
jgi:HK97 family phage major capsid protein